MLVTSRRSLILGLTSLVAAPSLVKATSLMHIRSKDLLDPWVLAYRDVLRSPDIKFISAYSSLHQNIYGSCHIHGVPAGLWFAKTPQQQATELNSSYAASGYWTACRQSELWAGLPKLDKKKLG